MATINKLRSTLFCAILVMAIAGVLLLAGVAAAEPIRPGWLTLGKIVIP